MQIVLDKDDRLALARHTGDVHNPTEHVGDLTSQSALFTFEDGWIRVEGKTVTLCNYRCGKPSEKKVINLNKLGEDSQYRQLN